jgi:type II secretory pathway component PulM
VKISTREKRFLIIGGIVALFMVAFYLVPSLLPEDLSAQVETKRNLLQRQRELIGQEATFKTRIAQAEQRLTQDSERLLPGANPSAAAPALQKVLQDLADSMQVEISRKTILPEQKLPENLSKVTVQLDISCTLEQLVRLITAIENYDKFLKVDELYIQGLLMRNRYEIRPSFKVSGFVPTPPAATAVEKNVAGK